MKANKLSMWAICHDNGYLAVDTMSHEPKKAWELWMERHATENGCHTKAIAMQEGYRSTQILLIWE